MFSIISAGQCKADTDRFCYIFEETNFAKEKRSITSHIKKMYKAYFDCYLDQDKSRAPHVYCLTCVKTLSAWYGAKNVHIDVPVIWLGQKGLPNDCYFCQHDFTDCTTAKKKKRNTLLTQICNQQCAQQSTQKIYLYPNLQIKKCR